MNLVRSATTVGGMTMISRVMGFVRDILIAGVLGAGPIADAFFVAFRFPNLFRRLFAEGAFNAAFVPLFARELEEGGTVAARNFAQEALSVLLATLLIFTLIAELSMPWLMFAIAPGFADLPQSFDAGYLTYVVTLNGGDMPAKYELAVFFTRIAFPYLLFMSLTALLSGVLNSLGRFLAAAAAPILLNIILVSAMLVAVPFFDNPGFVLSWGVAVAGAAQFFMLLMATRRAGFHLHLRRPRLTPKVRRLIRLGIPGVISGGVTQLNLLVGTIIASLQASAVSWLYYADRIYQLPLGVVGIAIGIVLLPDLARRLRSGDEDGALSVQNRSFEFAMLLTLPAAVALAIIPIPIISVLFERGAFGGADTQATALALSAYAFGLPAFVLSKVFSPGFFAREDTATPMRYALISIGVNIVLSIVLFQWLGFFGIALATTLAAWLNTGLLGARLISLGHFKADNRLRKRVPLILLAALLMGGSLWGATLLLEPWFQEAFWLQVSALALLVTGGMMVFAVFCQLTGAISLSEFKGGFRRKA